MSSSDSPVLALRTPIPALALLVAAVGMIELEGGRTLRVPNASVLNLEVGIEYPRANACDRLIDCVSAALAVAIDA